MADSELEFFDSLPRTRGAASALLRDEAGRVLLVKPTYRPGWGLPGGVIEMGSLRGRRVCGNAPKSSGSPPVEWAGVCGLATCPGEPGPAASDRVRVRWSAASRPV